MAKRLNQFNRINGVVTEIDGTIYRKEMLKSRQKSFTGARIYNLKADTIEIEDCKYIFKINKNGGIHSVKIAGCDCPVKDLINEVRGQQYDHDKMFNLLKSLFNDED